ncbi:hypothetical protein T484DRAFT_2961019 [Baffinella frigidus]|nr:hypothetical protein T484DRAFT_2961019 [Cryptophyta sp. CCMP2293]
MTQPFHESVPTRGSRDLLRLAGDGPLPYEGARHCLCFSLPTPLRQLPGQTSIPREDEGELLTETLTPCAPEPELLNPKPETRNPKPETRNPGP